MDLPIDVVPNRVPRCFRWKYRADSPAGAAVQTLEGGLPASVEAAVANLIEYAKHLHKENKELWEKLEAMNKDKMPAQPPTKEKVKR